MPEAQSPGGKRKLAGILAADAVGYSRLMQADDTGTVATLKDYRTAFTTIAQDHGGRVVNAPGDSILAEFRSAGDAVRAAIAIQGELETRNAGLSEDRRMRFRIGINLGDVIEEADGTLYGDGVNIAARLEALAPPGGICISGTVHDTVGGRLGLNAVFVGEQRVKNIDQPVRVYRLQPGKAGARGGRRPRRPVVIAGAALLVATVAGAGLWLFRGEIGWLDPDTVATSVSKPPAPTEGPSIAVLPFENLSGDPEQDYFADGLTEDIITGLSKFRELLVIARNSTSVYKGQAVDMRQVGADLGVRYVMEGSVRKAGERVRITAQLIDAGTGGHLWAERYDRDFTDIFALQDEVTREIVGQLKIEMVDDPDAAKSQRRTTNLEAYDFVLRGRAARNQVSKDANALARQMFEQAIALDANYADAYAELSFVLFRDWFNRWRPEITTLDPAVQAAEKALALDDRSAVAHANYAWVLVWLRRWDEALDHAGRAVALDPNYAEGQAIQANVLMFSGNYEEALLIAKHAMRLDPVNVRGPFVAGNALIALGRFDEAVSYMRDVVVRSPNFSIAYFVLAAALGAAGKDEAAGAALAEGLRLSVIRIHSIC
jgi:adenylate cyclase